MKTFAFISYARSDALGVANEIQQLLESYVIPRKILKKGYPHPEGKFIRRVFVDVQDLTVATTSFSEEIKSHIREAEYLIVLCSKSSARDMSYVHNEIAYFLETHENNTDKILPIALDGVLSDAIPVELHDVVAKRNIVIWDRRWTTVNRRRKNEMRMAIFKIVEFLLKIEFDRLYNRYWMAFWKKLRLGLGIAAAVAIIIITSLCVAVHQAAEREKEMSARINFEKHVFPLSIDFSYVKAFAAPLIHATTDNECVLVLTMPKNFEELGHSGKEKLNAVTADLNSLGWKIEPVSLNSPLRPRPLTTYELFSPNGPIPGKRIYLDVVTQLSAVKSVVDYLTHDNQYYSHDAETLEKLTREYGLEFREHLETILTNEFTNVKDPANFRKWRVEYVTEKGDLQEALNRITSDVTLQKAELAE